MKTRSERFGSECGSVLLRRSRQASPLDQARDMAWDHPVLYRAPKNVELPIIKAHFSRGSCWDASQPDALRRRGDGLQPQVGDQAQDFREQSSRGGDSTAVAELRRWSEGVPC